MHPFYLVDIQLTVSLIYADASHFVCMQIE